MKLNEDDVYAINQALRHCYKQDAQIYAQGTTKMVAWNELWDKFDGEQILKNQENVEKYGELLIEYRLRGEKIHELFQLKKRLNNLIDKLMPWTSSDIERIFQYGSPSILVEILQGYVIDGDIDIQSEELRKILKGEEK